MMVDGKVSLWNKREPKNQLLQNIIALYLRILKFNDILAMNFFFEIRSYDEWRKLSKIKSLDDRNIERVILTKDGPKWDP